jgi:hypothetical protein
MSTKASVQRMTTLSQEIATKTKIVTEYLTSKDLDAASYDVNGLAEFPIPPEDGEAYKARLDLVELTKELHDIALGPAENVRYLAWDVGDDWLPFAIMRSLPIRIWTHSVAMLH